MVNSPRAVISLKLVRSKGTGYYINSSKLLNMGQDGSNNVRTNIVQFIRYTFIKILDNLWFHYNSQFEQFLH